MENKFPQDRALNEWLHEWLVNEEIVKEKNANKREFAELILNYMEENDMPEYGFIQDDGSIVTVKVTKKTKKVLDKGALAVAIEVDKADLDPKGMVELTESKVLTSAVLKEHMNDKTRVSAKIKVRKPKKAKD